MILADDGGNPTDTANLPFTAVMRSKQMRNYMLELDRQLNIGTFQSKSAR